jgi:hypothetical protein
MAIDASETGLVKACLQYMQFQGIYCWRQNTGAMERRHKGKRRFIRFGAPGISDIIGCMPNGKFIAVECKVGRNTLTPSQLAFLQQIREADGIAIVAYSVDDVVEALASIGDSE